MEIELADASLEGLKATLTELGGEAKKIKKQIDTPIPRSEEEDAVLVAALKSLIADGCPSHHREASRCQALNRLYS